MLAESFLDHYERIPSLNRFQEFLLSEEEKKVLNEYVRLLSPYMEAISTAEMDNNFCSELIPKYSHLYDFISEQNQHKHIVQVLKKQTEQRLVRFNCYVKISLMQIQRDSEERCGSSRRVFGPKIGLFG